MLLKYYKFIFLCILMLLNSGCFRFIKNESGTHRNASTYNKVVTHHRVKAGETLYSIAFEYDRDHRDIARWNRIRRPYTIYPKQKLRIIPINSDGKSKKQSGKGESRHSSTRKIISTESKTTYVANSKLKWRWPTQGKVVSTFSMRDPGRRGIDIDGKKGQPIIAAAAGTVVYHGNSLRGLGNLIILKHNETYFSAYAHTKNAVIKEDEKVKLGQKLADMGITSSNKIILHFEIRRNGKPVNPMRYLPKRR
jgi:lipoprotein NlpD